MSAVTKVRNTVTRWKVFVSLNVGLGSKKHPVHLLVPHGAFEIKNPPALKQNDILSWFESCTEGKVEGIVWHCHDGCLIKVSMWMDMWKAL